MSEEIMAPKIEYEEEIFEIISQDHLDEGRVKIEYKSASGKTALVMLRRNNTYDEYIHNKEGELLSYQNKEL